MEAPALSARQRQLRADFARALGDASAGAAHRSDEIRQRRQQQREALGVHRRRLPVRPAPARPRTQTARLTALRAQAELGAYEAAASDQASFLHHAALAPAPAPAPAAWGNGVAAYSPPAAAAATAAAKPSSGHQSALERSAAWAEALVQEEQAQEARAALRQAAAHEARQFVQVMRRHGEQQKFTEEHRSGSTRRCANPSPVAPATCHSAAEPRQRCFQAG